MSTSHGGVEGLNFRCTTNGEGLVFGGSVFDMCMKNCCDRFARHRNVGYLDVFLVFSCLQLELVLLTGLHFILFTSLMLLASLKVLC